jgi:hypothetical protein
MKRYIFILSIVLLAFMSSCADQLEQEPANAITTEQIKEILESGDEAKIDLIIGGIANNLPYAIHAIVPRGGADQRLNSSLRLNYYNSLVGYDIICGEGGVQTFGYDAYLSGVSRGGDASSVHNYSFWSFGWSCVVNANKLLQYMPENLTSNKLKDYKARALTLRAYGYNFLMENYRDAYTADGEGLMIYDKIDPSAGYKPVSSAGATYDFIKQDLNEAVQLFNESGIGSGGYTEDTRDIDLGVANFVMARVSLLTGDYGTVISACDAILAKYPDLIKPENYGGKNTGTAPEIKFVAEDNAFVKFGTINPEVIFGFDGVTDYRNAVSEWLNIFGIGNLGGSGSSWARIVSTLYDAINPNDIRQDAFLDGSTAFANYDYVGASSTVTLTIPAYSNLKFAVNEVGGKKESTEIGNLDACYMRASEVLLMKAEAQARNNNETGAKETLNKLLAARTRPGQPALTCDNYGGAANVLEQVKLQWRIEMWGENGLEYYNNKRWGNQVVRSAGTNHWDNSTIPVNMMKWGFPTDEIIYNPNLN